MQKTKPLTKSEAIPNDSDTIWFDGRLFDVIRIPRQRGKFDERKFEAPIHKDPYEALRKKAPQDQRKAIIRLLGKEKTDALREKLEVKKLTSELRQAHADELRVTEQEIANKVWEINA